MLFPLILMGIAKQEAQGRKIHLIKKLSLTEEMAATLSSFDFCSSETIVLHKVPKTFRSKPDICAVGKGYIYIYMLRHANTSYRNIIQMEENE